MLPLLLNIGRAQIAIDDLSGEVSIYGDVILRWTIPQGTIISKYTVYRGTDYDNMKIIAEIPYPVVKQYTDLYTNIVPGRTYIYGLKAVDVRGAIARKNIEVHVTPPPTAMHFISIPPVSATVGGNYYYVPIRTDAPDPEGIEYSLIGSNPDGMVINTIGSGTSMMTFLYWNPRKAGQYGVTLLARHKTTRAFAVQEFYINVAAENQIGTIRGRVQNVQRVPLVDALVRVVHPKSGLFYDTRTDTAGIFEITRVQTGEIYVYASASSDQYLPQWYSLGRNISDVSPRILVSGDTLSYEFFLLTSPNNPTQVAGLVKNPLTGLPIDSARISFVRKKSFINIGDTTILRDPSSRIDYTVDTMVATSPSGQFAANLIVGREYFTIVEHPQYLSAFNIDRAGVSPTNALDARPIRITDNMTNVNFSLTPNSVPTPNRIVGTVQNALNGLNKQAVIVLINPDISRGAGGGHTYRRVSMISDKNGFYTFDNLDQGRYSILAIPLEKALMPQFYSSTGGASEATKSDYIVPNGTNQDFDFSVKPVAPGGVGTIFGQVVVQTNTDIKPATGTLVMAMTENTNEIAGYAISDSTGWYSITGLPKGKFIVMGQSVDHGSAQSPVTDLDYSTFNAFTQVRAVHLTIDLRVTSIDPASIPEDVTLEQNYPNPFSAGSFGNSSTQIRFGLPVSGRATVRVFNAVGREIAVLLNEQLNAGTHVIDFDGRSFGSGTYYYQLQFGNRVITRSMLLVK